MKKVYLIRHGAYGDHVDMTNVIKVFDEEGWEITFEYNIKGSHIHAENPRINKHILFDPYSKNNNIEEMIKQRKEIIKNCDRVVDFQGSLEGALIAGESTPEYFWPKKLRNEKNSHICYYDQSMKWAGFTGKKYMGRSGEIFFTKEEHEHVRLQIERYKEGFNADYVVLWCLRGTMWQKAIYPLSEEVCRRFQEKHKKVLIITTGDDFCQKWEWAAERTIHRSGRMPFRQAALMARYVDMVVTPETGLGIVAGVFGTPKIMLLTAASIKNITGNDENDFSLQSEAWCSPCSRAIYNVNSCMLSGENKLPICVNFNKETVLDRMKEIYDRRKELRYLRDQDAVNQGKSVFM